MEARKRCFAPVVNARTRILVLGSLPGEKSLAQGQYYANKQNAFWFLMSNVLDVNLVNFDYETRLATLLHHGVGLWDVIADAQRHGSLDTNIKAVQANDLAGLVSSLPDLAVVAFNGRTAAKLGTRQLAPLDASLRLVELPSSSPAFTLAVSKKLEAWMELRN
jgi:hypoxanthine-DNA glycosylase